MKRKVEFLLNEFKKLECQKIKCEYFKIYLLYLIFKFELVTWNWINKIYY